MKVTTTATDKLFEAEDMREGTKRQTWHTSQGRIVRENLNTQTCTQFRFKNNIINKRVIVYNFKKSAVVSYM